jgi:hypothetical protein
MPRIKFAQPRRSGPASVQPRSIEKLLVMRTKMHVRARYGGVSASPEVIWEKATWGGSARLSEASMADCGGGDRFTLM